MPCGDTLAKGQLNAKEGNCNAMSFASMQCVGDKQRISQNEISNCCPQHSNNHNSGIMLGAWRGQHITLYTHHSI